MSYKAEYLIIHCSDSTFGNKDIIKDWHVNGNGWRDIGYNAVIPNGIEYKNAEYNSDLDGEFQEGRALDFNSYVDANEIGAQCLGYNKKSIGICLIGKRIFTIKQYMTLYNFCKVFKSINKDIKIVGHYEMPTARGKTCPNFDMDTFREILDDEIYTSTLEGTIELRLPTVLK